MNGESRHNAIMMHVHVHVHRAAQNSTSISYLGIFTAVQVECQFDWSFVNPVVEVVFLKHNHKYLDP